MESIEKKIENYAVVFNVNLIRATLNEATDFRDYIDEAIHESDKDIIVNLSACEHLDSTFLGVLVSCYKKLKMQNRSLVIIEPINQSSIFLTLNSIGKIFPLYTNLKVALEDIENRRLLEQEIDELSQMKQNSNNGVPKTPNKKVSEPLVNKHVEELANDKILESGENSNEVEPVNKNLVSENIRMERNSNSDVSISGEVIYSNDHTQMKTEQPGLARKTSFKKPQLVREIKPDEKNQEVLISGHSINSGPIAWEFGFN